MQFRILGPLEVVDDGRLVDLGRRQQRALLALLLLRANEVVSLERLIAELWEVDPPAKAANTLQVYVSHLRKTLGRGTIVTQPPGYIVKVAHGALDLHEFERLFENGRRRYQEGDSEGAIRLLEDALALWRGAALADFAHEPFAQSAIARLEELRVAAAELSIDAELSLGRHGPLVGRLEQLVAEHPLRERLREQLMLALYRSGRQAHALAAYQDARRALVDDLGIEPGRALHDLEQAILRHDPSLELEPEAPAARAGSAGADARPYPESQRGIVVVSETRQGLEALLSFAEPISRTPARELIIARLVQEAAQLADTISDLDARRQELESRQVVARVTAFTSAEASEDVVRLAARPDVDLLLVEGPPELAEDGRLRGDLAEIVSRAPCDVALVVAREAPFAVGDDRAVFVPFGGDEHEWAAAELGAWIARSQNAPLWLIGSTGQEEDGQRDASRLLGNVALVLQRVAKVVARPLLVAPGAAGVVEATAGAGLVVLGLPDDWRHRGLGSVRAAVARAAEPPVLLVRNGTRPGALAPSESLTRFGWTLSGSRA